ncbi:hypothetical protein G7016_16910 [Pseudomonas japonica]|nr:hypothetical protein [Pseudomonas japonica]
MPYYCPVNEISFWAWAGGDVAYFNPGATGRGLELKHQLVRASIAAIEAVRAIEPRARFVQADPLINVRAAPGRPGDAEPAEGDTREPWLDYIGQQVAQAMAAGVPLEGVCLYPVLDYLGWDDDRHCHTGLLGFADIHGHRQVHGPSAAALKRMAQRCGIAANPNTADPLPEEGTAEVS